MPDAPLLGWIGLGHACAVRLQGQVGISAEASPAVSTAAAIGGLGFRICFVVWPYSPLSGGWPLSVSPL